MSGKIDWIKLRREYINGNTSYRKLAEKHGVSFQTLRDRAVKEKWYEKRKVQRDKIQKKTEQKTVEKIAEKQSDFAVELQDTATELLKKISKAVRETDIYIERTKLKVPKKVRDKESGETYTAWQEQETINLSKKNGQNIRTLLELANALKTLQAMTVTDKTENIDESPNINISIVAATPDDLESDE